MTRWFTKNNCLNEVICKAGGGKKMYVYIYILNTHTHTRVLHPCASSEQKYIIKILH